MSELERARRLDRVGDELAAAVEKARDAQDRRAAAVSGTPPGLPQQAGPMTQATQAALTATYRTRPLAHPGVTSTPVQLHQPQDARGLLTQALEQYHDPAAEAQRQRHEMKLQAQTLTGHSFRQPAMTDEQAAWEQIKSAGRSGYSALMRDDL